MKTRFKRIKEFLSKPVSFQEITRALAILVLVWAVVTTRGSAPFVPGDVGSRIRAEASGAIVKLTPPSNASTGGTGFQVRSPSGRQYTLTNSHICELAESGLLRAWAQEDSRYQDIRVIEISATTDLCVAEAVPQLKAITVSKSAPDFNGHIWMLGHPYLDPVTLSDGYLVGEEVVRLAEPERDEDTCKGPGRNMESVMSWFGPLKVCVRSLNGMLTSMRAFPGNSGSPVLNDDGQLVGVLFAGNSLTAQGIMVTFLDLEEFLKTY